MHLNFENTRKMGWCNCYSQLIFKNQMHIFYFLQYHEILIFLCQSDMHSVSFTLKVKRNEQVFKCALCRIIHEGNKNIFLGLFLKMTAPLDKNIRYPPNMSYNKEVLA